jgi:hypothetical protein
MLETNNPPSLNKSTKFAVIFVVLVLVAIVVFVYIWFGVANNFRHGRSRVMQARKTIDTISMAMQDYHNDFNAYPPEIGTNGSRMIATYLTRGLRKRDSQIGPYLKVNDAQLTNSDGKFTSNPDEQQFLSPLGGEYAYVILKDTVKGVEKETGYLLIDPGCDKLLGGTISNRTGFEITDPKAAEDNVYAPFTGGSKTKSTGF